MSFLCWPLSYIPQKSVRVSLYGKYASSEPHWVRWVRGVQAVSWRHDWIVERQMWSVWRVLVPVYNCTCVHVHVQLYMQQMVCHTIPPWYLPILHHHLPIAIIGEEQRDWDSAMGEHTVQRRVGGELGKCQCRPQKSLNDPRGKKLHRN